MTIASLFWRCSSHGCAVAAACWRSVAVPASTRSTSARTCHLTWQTSDLSVNHAAIHAWLDDAGSTIGLRPLELDVCEGPWPAQFYDAVFSANTVHIMGWDAVVSLFAGVGRVLAPQGLFILYGPFNYGGRYTSESNARFDQWLKARDLRSVA